MSFDYSDIMEAADCVMDRTAESAMQWAGVVCIEARRNPITGEGEPVRTQFGEVPAGWYGLETNGYGQNVFHQFASQEEADHWLDAVAVDMELP